jgi:hypothetical protein
MNKISSAYNRRLPLIGATLGVIGFAVGIFMPALYGQEVPTAMLILPLMVVPLIAYVLYKVFAGLADEVWDAGDALVVKAGGQEARIPLGEIVNVGYSMLINPPRVVLLLRNPTQLGQEISFIPKREFTLNPLARSKLIDDLIMRVDVARRKR